MRTIILDRDGVINEDSDAYVKSDQEWIPIPGSIEAIARLQHAKYQIFVATNQSGIGRGLFDESALTAMHDKFTRLLKCAGGHPVAIAFCPHAPEDHCDCRKPNPGLLKHLASQFDFDLSDALVIGDSLRDLEAADAVGATGFLVRTGKGKRTLEQNPNLTYPVFDSLSHVAEHLLSH